MVDKNGNSMREGIVEFSRKDAAIDALKKCSEACFFLTRLTIIFIKLFCTITLDNIDLIIIKIYISVLLVLV